ncbi:hypothetical protein L873DRAFT_649144 [Choiromyces venosus 120613-1]|uniref:Uncharacterized protein n=1 Tax=Choiromyces venosus 120613-1 TaxID=1336337 RepID=A0A3N4ITJ4_9PEZI|nr:hypothetical protein L873DRAFT_649144 [Choiromyces venosus 120613-1]
MKDIFADHLVEHLRISRNIIRLLGRFGTAFCFYPYMGLCRLSLVFHNKDPCGVRSRVLQLSSFQVSIGMLTGQSPL